MNRRDNLKLKTIRNELLARTDRHPLKKCKKVAILYAKQLLEASQDQSMLAECRL